MHRFIALAGALLLTLWSGQARAATVLETATLGPTGQSGGGASVSSSSWFGAIFSLAEPTRTISVSAHLRATSPGPIFAAILPIDTETDVPPCLDLSCALAVELFTPTDPSSESTVPIDVMLPAGDYAVLFGSGSAGATAQGVATLNNPMLGMPTFLGKVFFEGEFVWVLQTGQIDARFTLALADCGDGVTDPGEACDDGNVSDSDACLTSCLAATCGDGFVQAGVEACDDGNASETDACLTSCTAASCGDGFVQAGVEACDPGDVRGQACTADCELEAMGTTGPGETSSTSGDESSSSSSSNGTTTPSSTGTSDGSTSGFGSSTQSEDGSTSATSTTTSTSSTAGPSTTTGASTTAASTSSTGPQSGTDTDEPADQSPSESGCSCRSPHDSPSGLAAFALIALLLHRRRQ